MLHNSRKLIIVRREMPATVPVKDLDNLLQETLGPDLKVESSTWKPLTAPGENYGSLIYSVDASVKRNKEIESLHLVVKLPPPSAYLMDLFNSPLCFWKELVYYREIAPVFTELQFETNIEDNKIIRLMPQYYGGRLGSKDPNVFDNQAAIVMENLISVGYSVKDRLLGLDLEHTELVIEGLAKLHAIVIALKIRKPDFFRDTVIPALVHTANETAMEALRGMLKEAHDVYKQLPEAKPFLDRIDRTLKYDYETDWRTFKSREPWGTMVHNDFWSNNVLFKYNEKGKPVSIKIVDFQLGHYNSGALDLIFFLLTSAQEEVLDNHLDDMLDFYYKSFIDCLMTLNVDTTNFTRTDFYKEINRCAPCKFGQCAMMTNIIKAPRGAVKNIEIIDRDVSFSAVGNGEGVQRRLLHILDVFVKKRWLAD